MASDQEKPSLVAKRPHLHLEDHLAEAGRLAGAEAPFWMRNLHGRTRSTIRAKDLCPSIRGAKMHRPAHWELIDSIRCVKADCQTDGLKNQFRTQTTSTIRGRLGPSSHKRQPPAQFFAGSAAHEWRAGLFLTNAIEINLKAPEVDCGRARATLARKSAWRMVAPAARFAGDVGAGADVVAAAGEQPAGRPLCLKVASRPPRPAKCNSPHRRFGHPTLCRRRFALVMMKPL